MKLCWERQPQLWFFLLPARTVAHALVLVPVTFKYFLGRTHIVWQMAAGIQGYPAVGLPIKTSRDFEPPTFETGSFLTSLLRKGCQLNVKCASVLKRKIPHRKPSKHILFLQPTTYWRQIFFFSIIGFLKMTAIISLLADARLQFHCTYFYTSIHLHLPIVTKYKHSEQSGYSVYMCTYINSSKACVHDHPAAIPIITVWI